MWREVKFYMVKKEYLKKLQSLDSRVSLKNNRAFVGVEVDIDNKKYCIPLTSTIIPNSGKKRSSLLTINVKNEDNTSTIACLLLNNMIPVDNSVITYLDFNTLEEPKKRYHEEEFRYIKLNFEKIKQKATDVYRKRLENRNPFFQLACCDYQLLENNMLEIIESIQL